jgi:hypothetical protein
MKKLTTLLFVLFTSMVFAQVQKLSSLSSGKFIDSRIIYEDNGEDVYGYFFLYELDQKSREVYELEYVILDKNLNKVTSKTFTQGVYKTLLVGTRVDLLFVNKIKDEVIFCVYDTHAKETGSVFNARYRKVNMSDFSLSREYFIQKYQVNDKEYEAGDVLKFNDFKYNQKLIPTKGDLMLTFSSQEFEGQDEVRTNNARNIAAFDKDFKLVWSNEVNKKSAPQGKYFYEDSDEDVLVLFKRNIDKKGIGIGGFSFELYDYATGRFINSIVNKDQNYRLDYADLTLDENNVIIYYRLYGLKDKYHEDEKLMGYAKVILDKKTGAEKSRDYFPWTKFSNYLNVDKYGAIKKDGKLIMQNFTYLKNGNTIGIFETSKNKGLSQVWDMYVVMLDPQMNITYYQKIDKTKSLLSVKGTGLYLKSLNLFDFMYAQRLDNEDNYVFFYANNEREGGRITKKKNPEWVLGVITYVDGEFNYDKLKLTNKGTQIYPGRAKNGYIRLLEVSEKETEIRLEKINY